MQNDYGNEHLDYGKEYIDYGQGEMSVKEETKNVQGLENVLTDDSTIQKIPWFSLKHTIKSPDFDLKKF